MDRAIGGGYLLIVLLASGRRPRTGDVRLVLLTGLGALVAIYETLPIGSVNPDSRGCPSAIMLDFGHGCGTAVRARLIAILCASIGLALSILDLRLDPRRGVISPVGTLPG